MKQLTKSLIILFALTMFVFFAVSCTPERVEVTVPVEVPVEVTRLVEATRIVEVEVMVTPEPGPEGPEVPYEALWASSGHANASAEAFRHWDEADPKAVPASCAKCHSPDGYQDFLGADGSAFGSVETDHPISNGITCVACHNEVTATLDSVVMPSGLELAGLGDESRCMQCHQGRASKFSVDDAIAGAAVGDDDVSEDLGFINIHYYAAAATKYGTFAKGGYEYEGRVYDSNFAHVDEYSTCISCHDPHTLEVRVNDCQVCHTNVETVEDLKNVRMPGSLVDYDGDGDMSEGVYYELEGLRAVLYSAMQAYATDVVGVAVVYDPQTYPYFFGDDGARFASWTPRLLKAAYNYQVSIKDPGAFAHGGKYIIQLLYDSIADLNPEMAAGLTRIDHGHFAGSEEAFRHWDEDGQVSASCSKCHSAEGLPLFLAEGVSIAQPLSNGMKCATCHSSTVDFTLYEVASVTFPSGATVDSEAIDAKSLLCMNCHQGRSSANTVNGAVAGKEPDTVDAGIRFINIHYFAAGATRFGTEVKGAYEYDGKEYAGLFKHVPKAQSCVSCHSAHQLEVQVELCGECHEGVDSKAALH